jgi:FkbM family methyltransferase
MKAMGITPQTVIHVGSHYGQDNNQYQLLGVKNIYWCEADPICANDLRSKYPKSQVIEGVFWSEVGKKMNFWIMKNRAHNSLFEPRFPDKDVQQIEVVTTTLDEVFSDLHLDSPVMLVIDVQGAEVEVLQGAPKILSIAQFLICEITEKSSISHFSITQSQVEIFLTPLGYSSSIKRWSHSKEYYDQLYVKMGRFHRNRIRFFELLNKFFLSIRLLLRKSRRLISNAS